MRILTVVARVAFTTWVAVALCVPTGPAAPPTTPVVDAPALSGTAPLDWTGDIAARLVTTADQFLSEQLRASAANRDNVRSVDRSPEESAGQVVLGRQRLKDMLGLDDRPVAAQGLELVTTTQQTAAAGEGPSYQILVARWASFGDVHGEGLLLEPQQGKPVANVIALPHCDYSPEQLCGLEEGLPADAQFARRLAESGCRVVVPTLIDRDDKLEGISNREWLHRSAYTMGRTMTGYEVNKTLAIVDWFQQSSDLPIGVIGWGDGGMIAWYAASIDNRIDVTCLSGAFADLENLWQQPIDRMLFGLLETFGDAELAAMIAPRQLVVEFGTAPVIDHPRLPGKRGGPYRLARAAMTDINATAQRARALATGRASDDWLALTSSESHSPGSTTTLQAFLGWLAPTATLPENGPPPRQARDNFAVEERRARQMHEIDRHTQSLLRRSHRVRDQRFWSQLDTSSLDAYQRSIEPLREKFYDEVIGRFPLDLAAPQARTRLIAETSKWKRYELVVDVFDELFAYGILTVPAGIAAGEARPVVVCQHGLEGRPQDVIGTQSEHYYKAFATTLAEQGFVTLAPQNLYLFEDRFRTLQRKANSLGKTLFSIITPQHQQLVNWLSTQPFVDRDRIGFYGLSYGGKTAMRVPPLVTDYCLAICSADFNEWVDKNASTFNPRSYVNSGEYEIFEWNLGHTFNYAEMAALIAPRPFMVERGHFDGVADDWTVAWEYARVRHLYAARLKQPQLTEIEWFDGPHTINGQATYDFLHRHLNWPRRE